MVDRMRLHAAWAALLFLVPVSTCAADDFEADLLRKFKKQNQHAVVQVKVEVEKNLAKALALGPAEPEKAYLLLRETQFLLDRASTLSRVERDMLMRRLDDGFRDAKARLDSKKQLDKTPPLPNGPVLAGGPIRFQPIIGSYSPQATIQVAPVVGPGRRWVRIGVSGSFFFRTR
jgi:hypothetical protein